MKRYIFTEEKIENEYKYIFLCGTHYVRKSKKDKRNVLRKFLKEENVNYRPIILEDNFIFKKNSSRFLVYDDIHMKNLYQVEMLMNYLSDNNIIIHESISTGAETGLFLSEPLAVKKTCLLVPDVMAVEENKIGQFIEINKSSQISRRECYEIVRKCSVGSKGLPLGLVSSPVLANLYLKEFDGLLYGKIKKMGLKNPIYTRIWSFHFKECRIYAKSHS